MVKKLQRIRTRFHITAFITIKYIISLPCRLYLQRRRQKYVLPIKEEKVIVSMTSWKKRISNVCAVVKSIRNNSVLPDQIILNLSLSEFPNKESDLPADLVRLQQNGDIRIIWQGVNTKAFKKIIPTLKEYPDDIVISIDDDFLYPEDFIETFLQEHLLHPDSPLSGNNVPLLYAQPHCGCASLVKAEFFGRYIDELLDDTIIQKGMDDVFYTFCAALNGYQYRYVGKLFYLNMRPNNPVEGLSDNPQYRNEDMCSYLIRKIRKRYKIDFSLIKYPTFCV